MKKRNFIVVNDIAFKRIKKYTEMYKEMTGEFISLGRYVEYLANNFSQIALDKLIIENRKNESDEAEMLEMIDNECKNIIEKFNIGGR